MRIDVVVNTTARLYLTRPRLLEQVRAICAGRATVHPTSDVIELEAVARTIAERGSDLVVISGGDGSFMAGVTALYRAFGSDRLPTIAFLPGGTAATVARNWGMRGELTALLIRLLDRPEQHAAPLRQTLRVTTTNGAEVEERVGFIFGTGLVARFFDVYYQNGARGYDGAARIVARIFVESFYGGQYAQKVLEPMPCSIEVEGRRLGPEAWSLVCAAVVRDLGIHMLVTYRAGEDPARVHLVASPLPTRSLGPRAPLVLAGKTIGGRGHFDDLVREFTVRFPGHGPIVLDGDVLVTEVARVSAGPLIRVIDLGMTKP